MNAHRSTERGLTPEALQRLQQQAPEMRALNLEIILISKEPLPQVIWLHIHCSERILKRDAQNFEKSNVWLKRL